jgi:hypothetical protein
VTAVVIPLLAVLCVAVQAVAQPAPPPQAAGPDGAPLAASRAPPQGKVWTSDREQPLPEWDPEPARTWYGWQTLLVDALAIGTAALTATTDIEGFWLGVGMLVVGSPIVHIAHLNFTQGLVSFGMRLVPGSLFVLAGTASGDKNPVGFGWLGVLATTVVLIVDAAVLAWKEHPREAQARAWLTPWLDPQRGDVGLSYAARF